jgi:hypothetical protein
MRVFLFFSGILLVSYGIMFLDRALHLWASAGLDYSAHAAVALTLVMSLCALWRQIWTVFVGSLVVYGLLMLYQKYHSLADLVSTVVPIAFLALLLGKFLFGPGRARKSIESGP